MKGVVMDKSGKSYIVLTEKGDYIRKKLNKNYELGEEINVVSTSFDYKSFSAAAAVLILVGILAFNMLLIPYGYAEVAINPSVELGYNRLYNVVKYKGLNEDGVELLKSIKKLKGMQVEEAIDYLVKEADEKGYMSETEENYVVVAYTSKNGEVDKELEIKVNEKIKNVGTEVALMNMEKNHYGEIREKKENPAIEGLKEKLIEDITLLKYVGINPVVVHGGGPAINKTLDRLNIESNFIDGLRVTDKDTMEIVEMVLSAQINKEIVALMNKMQAKAVGISGKDGSLIRAKKKEFSDPAKDLGFVGEVDQINPELVEKLIEDGYIPVIAPVGVNEKGETLNINADSVAGELAAALKAEKLIYLTDVDGIRYDAADESTRVSQLTFSEIKEWIADGKIKVGMLPKVEGCMQAVESGVIRTHILNGLVAHPLLLEIFTDQGVGTMILKD